MNSRNIKFAGKRLVRALGRATGSSHQVALGVAIGFFVAWLPIVGIQMVVSIAICHLFKANKVAPIFPVWITNPATIIPIYSFNYWIGWLVTGGPPISDLAVILMRMLTPPPRTPEMGWLSSWWAEFAHSFRELLSMGWEMQLPLWLGCAMVGLALAVPSYYLTRRLVELFRKAVLEKRRCRHELYKSRKPAAGAGGDPKPADAASGSEA
ncbi:MAG: DUF2062 domain-containing protein [Planctomycetota bacterium]|nr:DUF2062 domain-containing protein [Planctomycetota bacterium]